MANYLSLCLFIVLLELSLLQAQAQFRRPVFNRPRFFRPPQNFQGRRFPFAGRQGPTNFMPFQRPPVNQQNGFSPFNDPFNPAMNRIQRFPNGAPNAFPQLANGFNQQADTNNAPPTVVMGTLNPESIGGISGRFGLPTGQQLRWQMSSPPSEDTNTFGNTGVANTVPGVQPGFNGLNNFQQPTNLVNGNNIVVPNGLNGNTIVPQTRFQQGFQPVVRPPTQNVQTPLIQQPISVINPRGLQQQQLRVGNPQLQNQVLPNQQLPTAPVQVPGLVGNAQSARASNTVVGQISTLQEVPVLPSVQPFTSGTQSSSATSQSFSNVAAASNAQAEVRVPISPAIPGMSGVPREAIQSNGTFEFVEVITISDADGNIYYQGLNSTDADHRRIENILTQIQKNQTEEAHRRGRAGLATLPDSASSNAQIPGFDSSFPSSPGQSGNFENSTGNITVMDENNNILYQGPEIPEAELQAHIKSVLEAQERQKLMAQDQALTNTRASSNSQQDMTSSSSSASSSTSDSANSMSGDVSGSSFEPIQGPVGFNPISQRFMPNSFQPARNIPSQFPPNFDPSQERFNQRMNSARSSNSRTNDRGLRSGFPGFSRSNQNQTNNRRDQMMNRSRNNIDTGSDSRMNSDSRVSPGINRSRSPDRRGRVDGQVRRWFNRFLRANPN